jgi:hypothetical protein
MAKGEMLMNIKSFRKDVRGAALVYVIVAAAIILLLGAATTATAYANLRATQIQEQSDNNFYSADTVMNAIVSGLESDVSIAYEYAYTHVMTRADLYASEEEAVEDFKQTYLTKLDSLLNDGADSFKFYYSTSHLMSYVESVFSDDIRYTISALNGNNYIDVLDNGIVLRNLHVTYENDNGYYDEITTDVKMTIPEFAWGGGPTPVRGVSDIIIDDGLEIEAGAGLVINGDVYINEREADSAYLVDEDEARNAILLNDGTHLTIATPTELIAGGLIKTKTSTTLTLKGVDGASKTGNKIWTENFDLGRYTQAFIGGQAYVYDDLGVNGTGCDVVLSGEYYGYNRADNNADESSAININGAQTKLDIEALDILILGGSSYVSATTVNPIVGTNNTTDVQTGEAISVKSNQIAYLVDDFEFSNKEIRGFVSNPMSYAQYESMCEKNGGWSNVASKLATAPVLDYSATKKSYMDYGATVVRVFSSHDQGTVYLYLNFTDPNQAAEFFVDAYKGDSLLSQRLRTYAAQYITNLKLNADTSLLVNQNYINAAITLYTNENLPQIYPGADWDNDGKPDYAQDTDGDGVADYEPDGLGYGKNQPAVSDEVLELYRNMYLGEDTDEDNDGKKYEKRYNRMINQDQLKKFIERATSAQTYVHNNTNNNIEVISVNGVSVGVAIDGTNGHRAILIDNRDKVDSEGNPIVYQIGNGSGIVIASGDVEIVGDWTGSIIIGGRVYCVGGTQATPVSLNVDHNVSASVTPLYFMYQVGDEVQSMSVMNVFIGCENMRGETATQNSGINADMVSNCITFTNWNRY